MAFRLLSRTLVRNGRTLSTQVRQSQTSSSSLRIVAGLAAVGAGLALFDKAEASWSSWLFGTPDYDALRKDIAEVMEDNAAGPLFVRLAWHLSGTYDKTDGTGGSNGCTMRFKVEASDPANAGLHEARNLLEPLKEKYPKVTYADLYTYAGAVAIEEMGGPKINWKPGRVDHDDDSNVPPNGRLPDASRGASHLRDIFYRMGFNDREIVALSGAHTLGFCHTDRSGFDGPWTENPFAFDNDYFKILYSIKWTPRPNFTPFQYQNPDNTLMMLPTDIALTRDDEFDKFAKMYAEDEKLWHQDFADAFAKLLDLGVPRS